MMGTCSEIRVVMVRHSKSIPIIGMKMEMSCEVGLTEMGIRDGESKLRRITLEEVSESRMSCPPAVVRTSLVCE